MLVLDDLEAFLRVSPTERSTPNLRTRSMTLAIIVLICRSDAITNASTVSPLSNAAGMPTWASVSNGVAMGLSGARWIALFGLVLAPLDDAGRLAARAPGRQPARHRGDP